MIAKPDCADCGTRVSPRTAKVFVDKDGETAKVLCRYCQPKYPDERQYAPTDLPSASRPLIRGGERR